MSGQMDVVIAGGVESMSRVPMFSNMAGGDGPFGPRMMSRYPDLVNQGISAEMIADQWNLSRAMLDEIAAESQQRAARATKDGLFDAEITAVEASDGSGQPRSRNSPRHDGDLTR